MGGPVDKRALRRLFRGVPVDKADSEAVARALLEMDEIRSAPLLLLYWPLPDEIDITPLIELFRDKTALPWTEGGRMGFSMIEEGLVEGPWGTMEPKTREEVVVVPGAVMVAPGLAFGRDGRRLGRGKGYYDRWLRGRTGLLRIGVAPRGRILDDLPSEGHDEAFDLLLTPDCGSFAPRASRRTP